MQNYPQPCSVSIRVLRAVQLVSIGIICGLASVLWTVAWAEDPAQVQRTMEQAIEIHQQTQKQADDWAGRKHELQARYQVLVDEERRAQSALALAKERHALESKLVNEARRSIAGATEFERDLMPFLEKTVTRLEEFIALDLPFLPHERAQRLTGLREILIRSDATAAEKLRRVMEAVQIEADYGRSVEAYQDSVNVEGTVLLVDVLRVGRISLFCRTPDGRVVAHFDPLTRKFLSLPKDKHAQVAQALEVARRERTAELLELPIGRIETP